MNVLSLFSGIGGLDLGLQRAGMTIVGQVEIDPWCRKILAKHWPEVPRHDDVRTAVDWWRADTRPAVDLVAGGVPCQPVSVAGKGLAQADARWLWPATIDAIGVLRPRYALLENVTGLLARGMGDVLGQLAAIGYDAEWDCIPASAVGAPHQRDRVWIVAHPASPRHAPGTPGTGRQARDEARRPGPDGLCSQVADAGSTRPQGRRPAEPRRWPRPAYSSWWVTEPDVGRVAHGIPRRVDRIRGLGNAVVPQVAEHIGRLILTP